jgi:hypothetical protein
MIGYILVGLCLAGGAAEKCASEAIWEDGLGRMPMIEVSQAECEGRRDAYNAEARHGLTWFCVAQKVQK